MENKHAITFEEFPNLQTFKTPEKYLKALAFEIQKYAPDGTFYVREEYSISQYWMRPAKINLYRRLKRAYIKSGKRGVIEHLRCILQKNKRDVAVDSAFGAAEEKLVPHAVYDYLTNMISLVDNWLLPRREIVNQEIF